MRPCAAIVSTTRLMVAAGIVTLTPRARADELIPAKRPSAATKGPPEARIHDDIGLQIVVDVAARRRAETAAQCTDNAKCSLHRLSRPAQRQRQVADAQFVGVDPECSGQALCFDAQYGEVGAWIAPHQTSRRRSRRLQDRSRDCRHAPPRD